MVEAAISNVGLAKRVKDVAAAAGDVIRCDHVDVKRWLDGMVPQSPKPKYIARALSVKLKRAVSLEDVGFASDDRALTAEEGFTYPERATRAITVLSTLAKGDLDNDPTTMGGGAADAGVAPGVITGYLFARPLSLSTDSMEALPGIAAAERIRTTAATLMQMDFAWGGGHVRQMLLQFFREQVVAELTKRHPDGARREIFSAAAETVQLLGWSAYDSGRHGAAMRYFIQGLRLAQEANDQMMGGRLLANLSHQANFLGNFGDAVKYARAAQSATLGRATKNVEAMYVMMEARALASLGDKRETVNALTRAEGLLAQRDLAKEPAWISYYDAVELAGDAAHCFRDLGLSSETAEFVNQALDDTAPPRSRAFIQMVSAASTLVTGELEQALAIASDAVKNGAGIQSARYLKYVADFQGLLAGKYQGHPRATEFVSSLRGSRAGQI